MPRGEAGRAGARVETLGELKRWYIGAILADTGGNKMRAAEILGIDRRTLYRILDRQASDDDPEE